jgi:serine/threonine-protein kinase
MPVSRETDTLCLVIHGRYRQLQRIASGGIANVYLGIDEQLQRRVAIKRLKRDLAEIQLPPDSAWQEAKALAALQHPNIVTLFDFGEDAFGAFFIMEFIDGETLDQRLQRGPLDQDAFVEIARQALEGVNAAHQCGILHRDLKPSNFMLRPLPNGGINLKVLDFGLAKFQEAPSAQTSRLDGHVLGSIYYIAPEQFEQQPVDARSDLYSLGHVLYTCLAGHPAYRGETVYEILNQHMQGTPVRLEELRPDIDPTLTGWVHRLIQRHLAHRYRNSAEALEALYNWVRSQTSGVIEPAPVIPSPPPTPPTPQRKQTPVFLGLAAVGLISVIAVAGFFLAGPGKKKPETAKPLATVPAPSVPAPLSPPPPTPAPPAAPSPIPSPVVSAPVHDPRDLATLRSKVGQTINLRGTPVALGENRVGTITYLNFTQDYRDSVALVCFHDDDPEGFRKENLQTFLQRPLEVTGQLEEYRGNLQLRIKSVRSLRLVSSE